MPTPSEFLLDLALKNVLITYWDARSGLTRDWSEHFMHGVDRIVGTVPHPMRLSHWEFRKDPINSPGQNEIQLPPPTNALLHLAQGTIMVLGCPFQRDADVGGDTLVCMGNNAVEAYRLTLLPASVNPNIILRDNLGSVASWFADYRGSKTIAVSFSPSVGAEAFLDGTSLGISAIIAPTYPAPAARTFRLGNGFPGYQPSQNPLRAMAVCNSRLTSADTLELHKALVGAQWATLPYERWPKVADARLDWGSSASDATTYGPGSHIPFSVQGAGIGRIASDLIQGDVAKCYENRDPNHLELSYGPDGLTRDNNPAAFASGVWEWWWLYKHALSGSIRHRLCFDPTLPDHWDMADDGANLYLINGSLGVVGTFPTTVGVWTGFRVERNPGPSWTWRVYVNDVPMGTFSPGAVVTQSYQGLMSIPTDSRIAIGSRDGRFNWRKRD